MAVTLVVIQAKPALPPLLLTAKEMCALVAGAYTAQGSGDAAIALAAGSLLDKV